MSRMKMPFGAPVDGYVSTLRKRKAVIRAVEGDTPSPDAVYEDDTKPNECYFLLTISFFPNNCIPVLLPPQVKELIDAMDQDLKKAAQSSSALEAAAYQVTTIQLTNTHTLTHTHTQTHTHTHTHTH